MKKKRLLLTLIATGCVAALAYSSMQEAVHEEQIGLSKTSVFETPAPPAVEESVSDPGGNTRLPRTNPLGPPRVPHLVADFLPISQSDNLCLDCHFIDEAEEGGPVPLPESHYVDYRNAPDEKRDAPVGARYYCLSCHVPQTDAAPLVGNEFGK